MSEQFGVSEEILRAAYLEDAMRPGGVMHDIARGAVDSPVELGLDDVANVLLPPKQPGAALNPRWQLIENTSAAVKAGAQANQNEIYSLAERVGMRRGDNESLSEEVLRQIVPHQALWLVEGGANRTSVVRRAVAIEAMRLIYDGGVLQRKLYQVGSDRPIPRERGGKPNPEYGVAQEIAGDFLPDDDSLTEFGLNLASAQQAGYKVETEGGSFSLARPTMVYLGKKDSPKLVLVQPNQGQDRFSTLNQIFRNVSGRQFVTATNGQYRPKSELQANNWAAEHPESSMLPAVAIGDEPGYTVEHAGARIVTAPRQPIVYVNEMVVLHRLQQASAGNRAGQ